MLSAARDAVPGGKTRLIAVTLLTSLDREDLDEIGLKGNPGEIVQRLALLAQDCGLDGVVCSALEVRQLRGMIQDAFCLVTPGIRPADTVANEQKRIATPREAIENGSDYLVIGRPITRARDPIQVLQRLNDEILGQ